MRNIFGDIDQSNSSDLKSGETTEHYQKVRVNTSRLRMLAMKDRVRSAKNERLKRIAGKAYGYVKEKVKQEVSERKQEQKMMRVARQRERVKQAFKKEKARGQPKKSFGFSGSVIWGDSKQREGGFGISGPFGGGNSGIIGPFGNNGTKLGGGPFKNNNTRLKRNIITGELMKE